MHFQVKLLIILLVKIVASQIGERCISSNFDEHPNFMEHPSNCSKFLACGNGIWYEMECPARLHYNAERQVCDWPSEAHCKFHHINGHQIIPSDDTNLPPYVAGTECNPSNQRNFPRVASHTNDCRKFLICNRQWVEMDCPGDLLFSVDTLHCEYPKNAKCCTDCEVVKKQCDVEGSRFVHPDYCGSFFECQHGKLVEIKCTENYHYDPIKGMCIEGSCNFTTSTSVQPVTEIHLPDCPIDGTLFPNYRDCKKFFICNGGTLIDQSCPPSTFFSIAHNSCEDKADAVCA